MASREDGSIVLGPWGGSGGTAWSFEKAQAITKIRISVGDVIDSITFQYMDGAIARWSPRYGGSGGKSTEIELGSTEFIISMKGYYGAYAGMTIVYSLTFVTTVREYGPYGREQGTQFSVPKGTGWISGFQGRSGNLLDAIGVYMKTSLESAVVVGPWGGSGGTPWLFENALAITKIKISAGDVIDSISFQYMDGATARWSPTYGGTGGKPTEIDLGTNNHLKAISGHYGNYYGIVVIRSLTFVSTTGTYGPFGQEEGTAFSLPVKAGNVVAFFGRAGQWLDALGFHLKPTSA
ncbi:mannose/glucose-specific lectin-like [Phoenix dactylifera]|uniref:Mannose/glucose-specific lectin-like n=1 Tax=Phoenix dactylifera TaxID=42345 RepID=A0A8B9AXX4_PHODC|nr:mannose/glucose-specific lectin-like [Phoenix dactylifera]XP_038990482.1 mannose/glucose-specific lectin-like [Phoenix dactylifera]